MLTQARDEWLMALQAVNEQQETIGALAVKLAQQQHDAHEKRRLTDEVIARLQQEVTDADNKAAATANELQEQQARLPALLAIWEEKRQALLALENTEQETTERVPLSA